MNIHTPSTRAKSPNSIDVAVGANVRRIRNDRGVSQEKLAAALGVAFQQVQKYEKGTNRISASKLVMIAAALDTTLEELFSGVHIKARTASAVEPVDHRVHKATRIFKVIPSEKMDHALKVLVTFTD